DPRRSVQRFLGFVEGRTQFEIPLRWEVAVVAETASPVPPDQAKTLDPYLTVAPFLRTLKGVGVIEEPPVWGKQSSGISLPSDTSMKKENARVIFTCGRASLSISERLFESLRASASLLLKCSVTIGPKRSEILLFDNVGGKVVLAEIESESGKLVW